MRLLSIIDNPDNHLPEPTGADKAYTAARIGLSSIPVLGGPLNNLLPVLLSPPIEVRRNKWLESIAHRIVVLEQTVPGFSMDSLKNSPSFVSAMLQASLAAIRTHNEAKIDALRNAVLNVATGTAPADHVQELFLSFVDSFTGLHLQILGMFAREHSGRLENFPYLRDMELAHQAAIDLETRGLVRHTGLAFKAEGPLYGTLSSIEVKRREYFWRNHVGEAGVNGEITELGKQFFAFITTDATPASEESRAMNGGADTMVASKEQKP
jgi:hypothetical protein